MAKQQRTSQRNQKQFQKLATNLEQLNRNLKAGKGISKTTMKSTAQNINQFAGTPNFEKLIQQFSEIARSLNGTDPASKVNTAPMQKATTSAAKDFENKLTSAFDKSLKNMSSSLKGSDFKKLSSGIGDSIETSMSGAMQNSASKFSSLGKSISSQYDKIFKRTKDIASQNRVQLGLQNSINSSLKEQNRLEDKSLDSAKKRMLAANDYHSVTKRTLNALEKGTVKAGKLASNISKAKSVAASLGLGGVGAPAGLKKLEDVFNALRGTKTIMGNKSKQVAAAKSPVGDCCESIVNGLKDIVQTISVVGQTLSNDLDRIANILLAKAGKASKRLTKEFANPGRGGTTTPTIPAGGGPPPPGGGPTTPPPGGATAGAATATGGGGAMSSIMRLLGKAGPIGAAIVAIGGLVLGTLYSAFKKTLGVVFELNEAFKEMARNTGTSVVTAEKLVWNSMKLLKSEKTRYLTLKEIQIAQVAMVKASGSLLTLNQKDGDALLVRLSETAKFFGYGADKAAEMHEAFRAMGADDALAITMQRNLGIMSEFVGIPAEAMMKDLAESAEFTNTFMAGMPDHLMKSVIQVRKLGFSMKQASTMFDKVTNLSGFMEGAVEVMALGGPNLSKVFYKALTGNPADMINELVKAVGGSKGFEKINGWTKKIISNTIGLSVEDINKSLLMNERMSSMGESYKKRIEAYEGVLTSQELADDASLERALATKELAATSQRMWDKITSSFNERFKPAFEKMAAFLSSKEADTLINALTQGAGGLGSVVEKLGGWAMEAAAWIVKAITWTITASQKAFQSASNWFEDSSLGRLLSGKTSIAGELGGSILKHMTLGAVDVLGPSKKEKEIRDKSQLQSQENLAKILNPINDFGAGMAKAYGDFQPGQYAPGGAIGALAQGSSFVRGAGTSTSDSIHAKLSVGERVVPASVNKQLGGIPNAALPSLVKGYATGTEAIGQDVKMNKELITAALVRRGIVGKEITKAILGNVGKESNFKSQEENIAGYANTSISRIRSVFGKRVAKYSDIDLRKLTKNPQNFAEVIYGPGSGARLGNNQPGDAWNYRGRGFIQITGKDNYGQASAGIGQSLMGTPDKALVPSTAADITAWYMDKKMGKMSNKLNLPGIQNLSFEQAMLLATSAIEGKDVRKSPIGLENLQKATSLAESLSEGKNPKNSSIGKNGQLSIASLADAGKGAHGQPILFNPGIEGSFKAMAKEASLSGIDLRNAVTDSYRDLAGQQRMVQKYGLYSQGGKAAVPGTSNHGWGLAMDVNRGNGVGDWMRSNGARFGFTTIPREPWHWENKQGTKNEQLESSTVAYTLPKGYLNGEFEKRRPYWEGTFANGTEFVRGPGTSKSDSISARLSMGERVVPANINSKLGGIPNEALPFLAEKTKPLFSDTSSLANRIQAASPTSLQYDQNTSSGNSKEEVNSAMVVNSVEQSNVVVVNGLQAVVQRLDRLTALMEQEVGLSGQIARKPSEGAYTPAGGSRARAGRVITPGQFEN